MLLERLTMADLLLYPLIALAGVALGAWLFGTRRVPPLPIPQIADVRPPSTAELGVVDLLIGDVDLLPTWDDSIDRGPW
jgi:hypothetical protein